MDRPALLELLRAQSHALVDRGMDVREYTVLEPAGSGAVRSVEDALGFDLPESLTAAFTRLSAGVEWSWFAPSSLRFPDPFRQNFCGQVAWSLSALPDLQELCLGWKTEVFSDPDDPYDRVWHDKLALSEVGNGDFLAVDLDPATEGAIVYLSHDDGEGHGHRLASDLMDLVDRWAPLAFTGQEDWQWLPFAADGGPIDPTCPAAEQWRALLGLTGPRG